MCKKYKITSQNQKKELEEAKKEVYLKGFTEGRMIVGDYAGELVSLCHTTNHLLAFLWSNMCSSWKKKIKNGHRRASISSTIIDGWASWSFCCLILNLLFSELEPEGAAYVKWGRCVHWASMAFSQHGNFSGESKHRSHVLQYSVLLWAEISLCDA